MRVKDKKERLRPQEALAAIETEEDARLNLTLRPKVFDEFFGQERLVKSLKIYVEAARRRGDAVDHILFTGPPGLGKTTLAYIVANEIKHNFRATSGAAIEKGGDLAGILTNLEKGDVLFIDEIHRLSPAVEEYLYSAMEDFSIDIIINQGPAARSIKMDLQKFTLIGSTTREGLLTSPFRSRFGIAGKVEYYPWQDLFKAVLRSARILDINIDESAAQTIAKRSRGTMRLVNMYLRRIRDLAQVKRRKEISEPIALEGLKMLGIDRFGLDGMDRRILKTILDHGGGPVGLKTIAVSVGESEHTIEDVYEPYLIQSGFLRKTPRGRVLSPRAYKYLDKKAP